VSLLGCNNPKSSQKWIHIKNVPTFEAGATFDNSFFDNCLDLVQQLKNRLFLGTFTVHKKVEITINRTKPGQQLCLINV
jgi:hypothetical protein